MNTLISSPPAPVATSQGYAAGTWTQSWAHMGNPIENPMGVNWFAMVMGLGVVLSPLLLVVVPPLISSLHVVSGEVLPAHLVHTAEWFFAWGYAYLFVTAASSILGCRLIAAGEQWIVTIIGLASRFIYAGAMVGFLASGAGLWGVALASTIQTLSVILATVVVTARRHRTVVANPIILGRATMAEMLRFGGLVQLSGILDALNYDTDPIVLGRFVSVTAAGLYLQPPSRRCRDAR